MNERQISAAPTGKTEAAIRHHSTFARHVLRRVAAISMAIVLAACSTDNTPFEGIFGEGTAPPSCPDVRILAAATTMTQFAGDGGQDLTDIVAEARLAEFDANCIQDVDPETGIGMVTVEISPGIEAARGPANRDGTATFPYFVSITDTERNILNKQVFNVTVVFERNAFRVRSFDRPVSLNIPIKPPVTGASYIVYLGLQLTEGDIEYNTRVGPALLGS